jgi:quinol-cytochrome oxidoreductase complex cytochrome b subunit
MPVSGKPQSITHYGDEHYKNYVEYIKELEYIQQSNNHYLQLFTGVLLHCSVVLKPFSFAILAMHYSHNIDQRGTPQIKQHLYSGRKTIG